MRGLGLYLGLLNSSAARGGHPPINTFTVYGISYTVYALPVTIYGV